MRITVSIVAVCGLSSPALCSVFSNGSFESPPVGPGAHFLTNGALLGPWTVALPGGSSAEHVNGTHVGLSPFDGAQFLSFNGGNAAAGGSVFQDFDTIAGNSYTVSFAVGRLGAGGGPLSMNASVLFGLSGVASLSAPASGSQGSWVTYSFQFTAPGSTAQLRFEDTSAATIGTDVALDGVQVVPAPGAAMMMSFTALMIARRRRE